MTALQYFIIYSQLARPYAFGLLFTLMAYDDWSLYFYRENKIRYLVYFSLTSLLSMYSHYISFLMVFIFSVSGVFLLNRQRFFPYLLTGIIMAASFIPHISVTSRQLSEGGVGGKKTDGWQLHPIHSSQTIFFLQEINPGWLFCVY